MGILIIIIVVFVVCFYSLKDLYGDSTIISPTRISKADVEFQKEH